MEHIIEFAHSVQGANHIKAGKECQDSSGCYSDELMSVIAVADGHGSDNYPRTKKGSTFAVNAALEAIKEFVRAVNQAGIDICAEQKDRFRDLALNILKQWHKSVDEDLANNPFQAEELEKVSESYQKRYLSGERCEKAYGTTLIAVCATADCWFGLHIGDGKCVAIDPRGQCFEPIPWDENCQANITTSICDSDAIDEFRFFCDRELPLGVFMGSDGIDDSYAGDAELYDLYRTILGLFAEHGKTVGVSEIKDFLPNISKNGSGDDASIAGLICSPISKESLAWVSARREYETALREFQRLEKEAAVADEKVVYIQGEIAKAQRANREATERLEFAGPASGEAAEQLRNVIRRTSSNLQQAEQRLAQADSLRDRAAAEKKRAEGRLKKAELELEKLRFFPEDTVISKGEDSPKRRHHKKPKKLAKKRNWKKLKRRKKH